MRTIATVRSVRSLKLQLGQSCCIFVCGVCFLYGLSFLKFISCFLFFSKVCSFYDITPLPPSTPAYPRSQYRSHTVLFSSGSVAEGRKTRISGTQPNCCCRRVLHVVACCICLPAFIRLELGAITPLPPGCNEPIYIIMAVAKKRRRRSPRKIRRFLFWERKT